MLADGGGPDAVRIEPLAQALGVTKGGFYWHFTNREALLTEMLDTWEFESAQNVIDQVEGSGGDGRARLRRLFDIVSVSGDEAAHRFATDLAIREWARRDDAVSERLRRVDTRRMEYLRGLYSSFCADANEVEIRCMLTFSMRIGSHLIAADHRDLSRAEVMALSSEWLLR
jgi:AcrR family transcriptional regulator